MKYMLIMRSTDESQAAFQNADFEEILNGMGRFNDELIRAGEGIAQAAPQRGVHARHRGDPALGDRDLPAVRVQRDEGPMNRADRDDLQTLHPIKIRERHTLLNGVWETLRGRKHPIFLEFPIDPTDTAIGVMRDREHAAEAESMSKREISPGRGGSPFLGRKTAREAGHSSMRFLSAVIRPTAR